MSAHTGTLVRVEGRLAQLLQVRGMTAAVVVDAEGLPLAYAEAGPCDGEALAAAARRVVHVAERMHGYGPGGPLELVTCEGPLGSMLVTPLGGGVALGVALSADAMVGAVRFALRAAARDLVPLVGG